MRILASSRCSTDTGSVEALAHTLRACSVQSLAHRRGVGGVIGCEQERQELGSRIQPHLHLSRAKPATRV
jgi:hypothetical protein